MRRASKKPNFLKTLFSKKFLAIAIIIFTAVALATTFWLIQNPQILESRAYMDAKSKKIFGCSQGYYRQGIRCVRAKGSSRINPTPTAKIRCSTGYYLSGNRCIRLSPTPYKVFPSPSKSYPTPGRVSPTPSNCPPAGSLTGTTYCSGGNLCARMHNGNCGTTTQCWPSVACAN